MIFLLFGFAVRCVLSAHLAILVHLNTIRIVTLIFLCRVVSRLTFAAGKCYHYSNISRHTISQTFLINELLHDSGNHTRADRAAAFSDGETEAFLHRDRLDELA